MESNHPKIILAVLPFQKASDRENLRPILQNFGEDLSNNLSKFEGLTVLSFYSTQFLSLEDPEKLKALNINYIITGSFRQLADETWLNVQLLSFPNPQIIFNQKYTINELQILATEDDLIHQIVNLLKAKLDNAILSHSYNRTKVSLVAYENWLLGNDYLNRQTPEGDRTARDYFEKALDIAPNFARAYSGISQSYFNEWSCQLWDKWEVSQKGAKKYALKAIEIDENDYLSLGILGRVYLFQHEFEKAEHYLRKSLKMNNNDANHLIQVALSLMFLGFNKEAETLYERSCSLNPFLEDRYTILGATILFENGKYEEALVLGKKIDIDNTYIDFPVYLAAMCYYSGNTEEALTYWDIFLQKFTSHIYFGKEQNEKDALSWHININPYQNSTKLTPFREYIQSHKKLVYKKSNISKPIIDEVAVIDVLNNFVQINYKGESITVKDTKGLRDLLQLIENPGQEIHCLELMGINGEVNAGIEVFDTKAKDQLQRRIKELQGAIAEAEEFNDIALASNLSIEYEQLIENMSSALGIGGRTRKVGSSIEKARAAVTLRIRACIKKIKENHEPLAMHLGNAVKTGIVCIYNPEQQVNWQINR